MNSGSKTRNMLEGLVKEGPFKWLLGKRCSSLDIDFEEMGTSPSARSDWIPELSSFANKVIRRCSRIVGISAAELKESFDAEASVQMKLTSCYARNFLEYCFFRTLAVSTQVVGHLADKNFRRLTYDMMLAWETPGAGSEPLCSVEEDLTVGLEAFCRLAPAVPVIANVLVCENLFAVLTKSTGGQLQFSIYDKYLNGLERSIRKWKTQSDPPVLSAAQLSRREKILEVEGTVTTQPVLEHVGISAWPGRLTLTDHALYFEPLRVVSYDKPKIYDLSEDLKQIVKPELTGPWGTRLFDKAVLYKSISLSEPVVIEFPELKGHRRRDYWLAMIREILCVHRFLSKFRITGIDRDEALSKAVLGIIRLQAVQDISLLGSFSSENLLMFNLCDQLPGGDLILETLAKMSSLREAESANNYEHGGGMYSISSFNMISNLGIEFGTSSSDSSSSEATAAIGEIAVGKMSSLETAVKESKKSYRKVALAQESVDGAKVEGIDTNLTVMKELLLPVIELGQWFLSVYHWEDLLKSLLFCLVVGYVMWRGWLGYSLGLIIALLAIFMVLTRIFNQGKPVDLLRVTTPPPMNKVEQLLALQNAISQIEQLIQDGNIVLLKFRGLLLSMSPQTNQIFATSLLCLALVLVFVPGKYLLIFTVLEMFTRHSPPRKAISERWRRRVREWWFSIPAAPVALERKKEDKKKK